MRRRPTAVLALALAAGCSPGGYSSASIARATETPATIVFDGQTVDVAPLRRALAGLCQAGQEAKTDAQMAKVTYDRRARDGVDTTIQVLRRSYSIVASSMTEAVERVDAAQADARLTDDLATLAELTREGLARLGITTAPCAE